MREAHGSIWTFAANVRVITTNGERDSRGNAVMGKGVALQAAQRYPNLPKYLGGALLVDGNVVVDCGPWGDDAAALFTFPVKHKWRDPADLDLIATSARQILQRLDERQGERTDLVVVMPRPGTGAGGLPWSIVKPVLEKILDDRFIVLDHTAEHPHDATGWQPEDDGHG